METFYIINQIPKINRAHWNLPWMSCILKFRSLKISLKTLERSFHRGEKTEICREASWDIWNSFTLSKQIFEKCVFFLNWKVLVSLLSSLYCLSFGGGGVGWRGERGIGDFARFFYIAGSLSLSLSSFLSHFEEFFTELI